MITHGFCPSGFSMSFSGGPPYVPLLAFFPPFFFFFFNRGILKTQTDTSLSALMVDVRTFAGAPGGAVFPIVSCKVTALALQPGSVGGWRGGGGAL